MIKQTIKFNTTAKQLYKCFMDEKIHSDFTGAKAKIENKVGGKFSVWDGYAEGENLELVPDRKIVQSWRASDWPDESISTIEIDFTDEKDSCRVDFTHKDIPEGYEKDIENGWNEYYWKPLKEYLKR